MIVKLLNWGWVAFWMIVMLSLKYPLAVLMDVQEFVFDRLAYSLAKTDYKIETEIEITVNEPFDHQQEIDDDSLKWPHADNV